MYTKEKTGQVSDGRYIQWNTMQARKRIQSSLVPKGKDLQETAVRDFPGSPVVDSTLPLQGTWGFILSPATRILQVTWSGQKKRKKQH